MSFLLNPYMFRVPIAIDYVATVSSTTNLTTYTFSSASLGAEATDRVIIVAFGGTAGSSKTISSVTIGGVAATLAVNANISWAITSGIYYAAVPSGTTGDIVITFSGSMNQCVCNVFRMTGQSSNTPAATGSDTTGTTTSDPNCNVVTGDKVVAFSIGGDGSACAWTGATEVDDRVVELHNFSAAQYTATSTETPHAIQAVHTSSTNIVATSAAWR